MVGGNLERWEKWDRGMRLQPGGRKHAGVVISEPWEDVGGNTNFSTQLGVAKDDSR